MLPNENRQAISKYYSSLRFLFVISLILFLPNIAWAARGCVASSCFDFTLFDPLLEGTVGPASNTMAKSLANIAKNTFVILAVIDFCWAAAIWVMEKDEMSSFMVEMIKKIMLISFFYYLLLNGPAWGWLIVDSFTEVGERAAAINIATVDGLMATGFAAAKLIFSAAFNDFIKMIVNVAFLGFAVLVAMVVIVCYTIAAAQLMLLKMEAFVVLAAGAIFLAFGGSQWTSQYVPKYLKYAVMVGVRLLTLLIILGILQSLVSSLGQDISDSFIIFVPLAKLMIFAIILAMLSINAPEMAQALLAGGGALSAQSAKRALKSLSTMGKAPFKAAGKVVNLASKAAGGGEGGNSASSGGGLGRLFGGGSGGGGGSGSKIPSVGTLLKAGIADFRHGGHNLQKAVQPDKVIDGSGADVTAKMGRVQKVGYDANGAKLSQRDIERNPQEKARQDLLKDREKRQKEANSGGSEKKSSIPKNDSDASKDKKETEKKEAEKNTAKSGMALGKDALKDAATEAALGAMGIPTLGLTGTLGQAKAAKDAAGTTKDTAGAVKGGVGSSTSQSPAGDVKKSSNAEREAKKDAAKKDESAKKDNKTEPTNQDKDKRDRDSD